MSGVIEADNNFRLENATVTLRPWESRYAIYIKNVTDGHAEVRNVKIIKQTWLLWFTSLFKRRK